MLVGQDLSALAWSQQKGIQVTFFGAHTVQKPLADCWCGLCCGVYFGDLLNLAYIPQTFGFTIENGYFVDLSVASAGCTQQVMHCLGSAAVDPVVQFGGAIQIQRSSAMPKIADFPYKNAQILELAKQFPTPFHLYHEETIRNTVRGLNKAFSWCPGYKNHFAVKAD